jgi:hypothetical protein
LKIKKYEFVHIHQKPWLRPKPGQAKPNFWLWAQLTISSSQSHLKPGQSQSQHITSSDDEGEGDGDETVHVGIRESQLVFESPVRSSYLALVALTETETG